MKPKVDQSRNDARRGVRRLMVAIGVVCALMALLLAGLQETTLARSGSTLKIGVNDTYNWVEVLDAAPNTSVTIRIVGKGEVNGMTDGNGYFGTNEWDPPLASGDVVTVENEGNTRSLKVGEISGQVDYETDKVVGVINAAWLSPTLVSVECQIWLEQQPPPITVDDVNPVNGRFECDFSGKWDIQRNQTVGVVYFTPEGDRVMKPFDAPWVRVQSGHDWVGADYEAGHTFWITVTDSADNVKASAQIDTQPRGGWQGDGFQTEPHLWTPENPDIQAGDWIYFRSDDGYTNTVRVGDIGGVVDTETDSVSGAIQAPWFSENLDVECHPWGGWGAGWDQAPVVNSTAAADGTAPYTCQWDPQTEWDVEINQDIAVFYYIPGTRDLVGNVFRATPPPGPRYVAVAGSDESNDCRQPQSPCATIQHAINQAAAGDEVRIASGAYTENVVVSGIEVTVRGGYLASDAGWMATGAPSIVDGDDRARVFFVHDGSQVLLERLVIQHGRAPEEACWGGGVSVSNGRLTLRNVVVRNNRAECTQPGSFEGAGGGLDANSDEGPGSLFVEDSLIVHNRATAHGSAFNSANATVVFTNVLVTGNSANVLGANETNFRLVNSTIVDNDPQGAALLDFESSSNITVLNSILWNSGSVACGNGGGACTITYSDVEGGWSGKGNIDAQPGFANPSAGDYRLRMTSPAIDAGTNQDAPDHDLVGVSRPLDGNGDGVAVADMGAYEFKEYRLHLPLLLGQPLGGGVFRLQGHWTGVLAEFEQGASTMRWDQAADAPFTLVLNAFDTAADQIGGAHLVAGYASIGKGAPLAPAAAIIRAQDAKGKYDVTVMASAVREGVAEMVRIQGVLDASSDVIAAHAASGSWRTEARSGAWAANHVDQQPEIGPPVDEIPGLWFDGWVAGVVDGARTSSNYQIFTNIASIAGEVTTPANERFRVRGYSDIFSPNVDFITEFRYLSDQPDLPISGQPYTLRLLDPLGQPILGAEITDVWTACTIGPPGQLQASVTNASDINLSWAAIPNAPGWNPAASVGFYQLHVGGYPEEMETSFGVNDMKTPTHLIPWAPFSPGSPGIPDGVNWGQSLQQFPDGDYVIVVSAFTAPTAPGGRGNECEILDSNANLYFNKNGTALTFFTPAE